MYTMDDFLEHLGITYDDLKPQEKEHYQNWYKQVENSTLTLDGVKNYIIDLRRTLEKEITESNNSEKQDLYLKARLRNLLLIESLFISAERAKQALESELKTKIEGTAVPPVL